MQKKQNSNAKDIPPVDPVFNWCVEDEEAIHYEKEHLDQECIQILYGQSENESHEDATENSTHDLKVPHYEADDALQDYNNSHIHVQPGYSHTGMPSLHTQHAYEQKRPANEHPMHSTLESYVRNDSGQLYEGNFDVFDSVDDDSSSGKRLYVDHSYIDFSRIDDHVVTEGSIITGEKLSAILEFGRATCQAHIGVLGDISQWEDMEGYHKRKPKTRNIMNFPKKLMSLLDENPDPNIISWLPHGRAFIVRDQTEFMLKVHPKHFNNCKYKTFQRMLNMWGFKRITKGKDAGSYYNQLFLRNMPNLVRKMTLTKKKDGVRRLPNPSSEPDFYMLSQLRPLRY